ncbi:MAG: glycosyltransferase, partial [Acidobacteria bacterium]|nr:glycosyltransferase [Acidobacteriota bacterium]
MIKNIISIVIPSYNQGPFIEETIQSILSQEGDFYIDCIIIDGASKDHSVSIIAKYASLLSENCPLKTYAGTQWYFKKEKNFPWNNCLGIRYTWLSEKDSGQVNALKKGFRLACGHIYSWLNSDDIYIHPHVFQKVITTFRADPRLELLCGDGIFISETGQETG